MCRCRSQVVAELNAHQIVREFEPHPRVWIAYPRFVFYHFLRLSSFPAQPLLRKLLPNSSAVLTIHNTRRALSPYFRNIAIHVRRAPHIPIFYSIAQFTAAFQLSVKLKIMFIKQYLLPCPISCSSSATVTQPEMLLYKTL